MWRHFLFYLTGGIRQWHVFFHLLSAYYIPWAMTQPICGISLLASIKMPAHCGSHYASGVSTAGARVNMYSMQLISCTLVSDPKTDMVEPTICISLGQSSSREPLEYKGQRLGVSAAAHTEPILFKVAIGEDNDYEAS